MFNIYSWMYSALKTIACNLLCFRCQIGAPPRLDVDRKMFILTGPLTSWKNFVVYLANITSVLSKSEYAKIFSTIPEFDFPKIQCDCMV